MLHSDPQSRSTRAQVVPTLCTGLCTTYPEMSKSAENSLTKPKQKSRVRNTKGTVCKAAPGGSSRRSQRPQGHGGSGCGGPECAVDTAGGRPSSGHGVPVPARARSVRGAARRLARRDRRPGRPRGVRKVSVARRAPDGYSGPHHFCLRAQLLPGVHGGHTPALHSFV
jgi:hypothetical protein